MRGTRSLTHPDLLQGHRRHRALLRVSDRPPGRAPTAPAGVLPATRLRWTTLWRSNLASVWSRETDLTAITRYILNLDKWLRYEEMVAHMPMLKGSKGQLRANPLANRMDALEGQLRFTEERYGLTPASRIRLGIEVAVHQKSVAELFIESLDRDYDPSVVIDLDELEERGMP